MIIMIIMIIIIIIIIIIIVIMIMTQQISDKADRSNPYLSHRREITGSPPASLVIFSSLIFFFVPELQLQGSSSS